MMPGAWPTRDGFPGELGCVDAESGAGGSSSSLPRNKMGLGSIRYGVSYSFRKAALKGFLDDLKAGCAEIEKGAPGVEDNTGVGERDGSRQRTNGKNSIEPLAAGCADSMQGPAQTWLMLAATAKRPRTR